MPHNTESTKYTVFDHVKELQSIAHQTVGQFIPIVGFAREGKVVACAYWRPSTWSEELGLIYIQHALVIGIVGFHADEVVLSVGGVRTRDAINPLTKEPWKPMEATKAAYLDGGLGGAVILNLGMFSRNRKGDYVCIATDVDGYAKDGSVMWGSTDYSHVLEETDDHNVIYDILRDSMECSIAADESDENYLTLDKSVRDAQDLQTCEILALGSGCEVSYTNRLAIQ